MGLLFSFIWSGSFFYNINPTTPLLNPPGAYLFLTHLIEEGGGGGGGGCLGKGVVGGGGGGGGGGLFEKGVGAYLTYYQFALKN